MKNKRYQQQVEEIPYPEEEDEDMVLDDGNTVASKRRRVSGQEVALPNAGLAPGLRSGIIGGGNTAFGVLNKFANKARVAFGKPIKEPITVTKSRTRNLSRPIQE